ncbi:transposase-like zinc-binding domain-containing protein, partial [Corynebacterium casei]
MPEIRPRCPLCTGEMKKNGKRNARTRWRCKNTTCGISEQTHRPDITAKRHFTYFHNHVTGIYPITECARLMKVSTRTVYRYFEPLWLIEIPNNPDK